MKSKGLGHTARGLLATVLLLTILLAGFAWVFERVEIPEEPGPAAVPAVPMKRPVLRNSAGESVRVALTRRAVPTVRLLVEGHFRVLPLGDGGVRSFGAASSEQSVSVSPDGIEVAGVTFAGDGVEVVPERSPAIWVDGRKYRGSVRFHVAGGGVQPVNVLPLEEYIAAVVDAEMPAAFPPAARQAQAVVARTYAISCRDASSDRRFDLYSTPVSQNYLGHTYEGRDGRLLAGETPAGRAAAAATAGLVCTYRGRLFRTYYSACCGGRTSSGTVVFGDDTPTLRSVSCGGCGAAPLFRWERLTGRDFVIEPLARTARTRLPSFGSVRRVETIPSGSPVVPASVKVSDGDRSVRLPAAEAKSALDLPSLLFELSGSREDFVARGRGHGHGVGLCQWGAKGLAERGLSAEQILRHYYPGCDVTRLK